MRTDIASWIHSYFDNVMTKFMINNNRTDALKTDVNLLILSIEWRTRDLCWLIQDEFSESLNIVGLKANARADYQF